ncbi:MAG: glucosamine-6-phosphate deaminase [Steroidobacteraceae bacterium]
MRILRVHTAEEFAGAAADLVAGQLQVKPRSVFALPTGNTPLALYEELVRRSRLGRLSLADARIFNLDEYRGLAPTDPHSYAAFLQRHLIMPLALDQERVRLLGGDATDPLVECRDYDAALTAAGGIDLCILGLGANGHIAFNEPGSAWDEHTHVVQLTQSTRTRHANETAGRWQVPTQGLTLGIASILAARQTLLLIAGAHKEAAKAALHRGVEDREWPVTSLLRAPNVTVIELSEPAQAP